MPRTLVALAVLWAAVPARAERPAVPVAGAFGMYDPETVRLWPTRLQHLVGGVDAQGALVAEARRRAAAAGNPARFYLYLSLTALDGGCRCWEAQILGRLRRERPELVLRDAAGQPVSVFLDRMPAGRMPALDPGNPATAAFWADVALAEAARHDWDGVWADNVWRGRFDATWSAVPIDPRSGAPYTTARYRADLLATLRALRSRFDAAGKRLVGNHSAAWRETDEDPVLRDQVRAMHGVVIEDFFYDHGGKPLSEDERLRQVRYLDFASRAGVLTWAHGGKGALMEPAKRETVLAAYLLTRRGDAAVGDLNAVKTWWPALATDLGAACGDLRCLDPGRGFAPAEPCPRAGTVLARDFAAGRVLVNPGTVARAVPLGGVAFRRLAGGRASDPLPLAGGTGAVLVRDGHDASSSASGRDGR